MARKPEIDSELQEEIRSHIELQVEENVDRGMSPAAARHAALLQFGNPVVAHEDSLSRWTLRALESFLRDLSFGARLLAKTPFLTTVVVLSLTVGIGLTSAMFIFVNAGIFHAFPFPHPEQLVRINGQVNGGSVPLSTSPNTLEGWRLRARSFSYLGAFRSSTVTWQSPEGPRAFNAVMVAGDFFRTLGVSAQIGRTLAPEDQGPCDVCPVVLTDSFWQKNLHRDPAILGRQLIIDGHPRVIIGVLPPDFQFAATSDLTLFTPYPPDPSYRSINFLLAIGRLKDGVSAAAAAAELTEITHQMGDSNPRLREQRQVLESMRDAVLGPAPATLWQSFAATCLVLIIACANVASVLLARGRSRASEVAIRAALGAVRTRLIRQFVTETLLLAVIAGAGGALLAWGVVHWLLRSASADLLDGVVFLNHLRLDGTVIAFVTGLTLLTALLFSALPAWRVSARRPSLQAMAAHANRRFSRNALIGLQASLATLLLIAAGLMTRSLLRLTAVDPHFNRHELALFDASFPAGTDAATLLHAQDKVQEAVSRIPGVKLMAFSNYYPLECSPCPQYDFQVSDGNGGRQFVHAYAVYVSENYFAVFGMRLLRGRIFGSQDKPDSPRVAVMNRSAAGQIPGFQIGGEGTSPPGFSAGSREFQPIGVVEDVKEGFLDNPDMPVIYFSVRQFPVRLLIGSARTQGPQGPILSAIQSTLRVTLPGVPISQVVSMDDWVDNSFPMFLRRIRVVIVLPLGIVALLLTSLALYGVVSIALAERLHELGVRRALGARSRDVVQALLGPVFGCIAAGIAAGLLAAGWIATLHPELLFQVSAVDPITYAVVPPLVLLVAVMATFVPARRACRVDPATTLRYE